MSGVTHLLRPELRDFIAYPAASPRRVGEDAEGARRHGGDVAGRGEHAGVAVGHRGAEALHEQRNALLVDAPHRVNGEGNLQVVAAEYGMIADEILGVRVRRDAHVCDVEKPAAARRGGPSLHAVETALPEDGTLGEVADVSSRCIGISRSEQPEDRREDAGEHQHDRNETTNDGLESRDSRIAVAMRELQHGRPPHAGEVS